MTGFAAKNATLTFKGHPCYVTVAIKSVNARFFEMTCKFPYALHHLETDLTGLLKRQLFRGHLFVSINISDQSLLKGTITPALSVAQNYVAAVQEIQKRTGVAGSFSLTDLVQLPYVFTTEEQLVDDEIKQQLITLMQEATQLLIKEQEREGLALQHDLADRLTIGLKKIAQIAAYHEEFMARRKEQILEELQTYTNEDQIIETRKAALRHLLDKIDIHEELVRFESHAQNLQSLITSSDIELGKRIDFTLQELTREINTISAKASDARMSALAIDIKVELEKAREQVQNIV